MEIDPEILFKQECFYVPDDVWHDHEKRDKENKENNNEKLEEEKDTPLDNATY